MNQKRYFTKSKGKKNKKTCFLTLKTKRSVKILNKDKFGCIN
jgi:hypothetical protein